MHVESIVKVTPPVKLYIYAAVVVALQLVSITVPTSSVFAALFVVSSSLLVPVTVWPFA